MLLSFIATFLFVTTSFFFGSFRSYVAVTLTSDRSGLVMEPGAKIKLRGVEVGKVSGIVGGKDPVSLILDLYPDQVKYIPANISARIRANTAFGAKYVDLIYPANPSARHISSGAVIRSENVSTEVDTVFQNLTSVLHQIDPAKLNAVLSALAEGLRGQGDSLGEAITDGDQVLTMLNHHSDALRRVWPSVRGFSDTYGAAAGDIIKTLDALSTTSTTIASSPSDLDALLVGVTGFAHSGANLLGANNDRLIKAINVLEPTTGLLMKYNPELTCLLVGGKQVLDTGFLGVTGGTNGKSVLLDVALLMGDDPYRYPDNLPINGAKGGLGGKPGCGSLPDVANNWPVRYLVTNTGYGTGNDIRTNPGIGFPGWANYFPVTRANPEPPSIRNPGGPAPGPIPYPGAPAYGQQQYAPDGTPLFPGLPPAPTGRTTRAGSTSTWPGADGGASSRRDAADAGATAGSGWISRRWIDNAGPTTTSKRTGCEVARGPVVRQGLRGATWRLAVFVAICLFGMFAVFAIFGGVRFGKGLTYNAVFSNVAGLESGQFVRIAGVEVGQVKDIRIQPDTTVRVQFTVDDSVVLTEGNRAVIKYDDLIGGRHLALEQGAGGTRRLPPGATIPLDHTSPALDLDALIGGFRPLFHALDPDQVNALSGQLIAAFQGQGATLSSFSTDGRADQHIGRPRPAHRCGHRQPQ